MLLLPFLLLFQSCKQVSHVKSSTDADFLSSNIMLTRSFGKYGDDREENSKMLVDIIDVDGAHFIFCYIVLLCSLGLEQQPLTAGYSRFTCSNESANRVGSVVAFSKLLLNTYPNYLCVLSFHC